VRAAIGNGEQAILLRDDEHLFAAATHQLTAVGAEVAALQSGRGKHDPSPFAFLPRVPVYAGSSFSAEATGSGCVNIG
jgi:hypothetical protein